MNIIRFPEQVKKKEPLVDTNNQNQITRWSQEWLDLNHSNQLYTDWEILTACQIRVLSNKSCYQLKPEYGIPRSTLKRYLAKICPPLQCRNAQHIHQMLNRGEVLRSKVSEIIKISVQKLILEDQLTLIQTREHWWLRWQKYKDIIGFPLMSIN